MPDQELQILILEDDEALRETLAETLGDDYRVFGAGSAQEALRLAEGIRFDLVLTDVRMAGMDGLDCLARLKDRFPKLLSIVMTGFADDDATARALRVQVEDYLRKPFTIQQLQQSVRRAFDHTRTRSAYRNLLQSVLKLVGQDPNAVARRELHAAEEARDGLVRTLFVAARSRVLGEPLAYAIYVRLEQLEEEMERLRAPTAPTEERQRLWLEFAALERLIQGTGRARAQRVDPEAFSRLFHRVQEGSVSTEELLLAPVVRNIPVEIRRGSPEMARLHDLLWAEGASTTSG